VKNRRVLVVSSNASTIKSLEKALSAWKMKCSVTSDMFSIAGVMHELPPDAVIVDEEMIGETDPCGLFTSENEDYRKSPSLIILTKSTQEANAINTCNGILCDHLKVPFSTGSLWRTLKRALEHYELSSTLDDLVSETRSTQNELRKQMRQFTDCLSAMMAKDVPQVEANYRKDEHIIQTLRPIVTSLLVDAKRDPHLKRYESQLTVLKNCIEEFSIDDCTEGLVSNTKLDFLHDHPLSKKEIRVMAMIKVGMTTEEIADRMNIASDTVKTHRRNIRKKLELVGNKCNLNSYLQAM